MKHTTQNLMTLCLVYFNFLHALHRSFAQEHPSLPFPNIYSTNVTYRHNLCNRQNLTYSNKVKVEGVLRGLDLSILILEHGDVAGTFLYALTEDGTIKQRDPGLMVEIMDEVARRA